MGKSEQKGESLARPWGRTAAPNTRQALPWMDTNHADSPGLVPEACCYLSTPHRHPHCGHSCALPSCPAHTWSKWTRSPGSECHPARWDLSLVQNEPSLVLTVLSHSPAACTRRRHRRGPRYRHTRSPTSGRERPRLSPGSCWSHSPVAADAAQKCPHL